MDYCFPPRIAKTGNISYCNTVRNTLNREAKKENPMPKQVRTAIQPKREEDYPLWYQEVIKAGDLAENSDVRGCMVIKPWGYGLWENIRRELDDKFKETRHKNAYFPLFIPLSYLQKEADHVDGFATECALVTHHKLTKNEDGVLIPDGELDEPLIIRPTSETIIGATFAKWINSYRDLPLLLNQWANVVRWERRTRLFLRTSEFLWQEGHTAHETKEEAREETLKILRIYRDFAQDILALPVLIGEKSESEKFPGAVTTYSIEAMMQDRKALQAGTSHFLGQKFAKASGIKFQSKEEKEEFAWTTSWGVSTRLIGALIMAHADDNGLVLPPRIASSHLVFLPIYKTDKEREKVLAYIEEIKQKIKALGRYHDRPLVIEVDDRDLRGGEKNWEWIKKGIPLKIEIGMRDIEKNALALVRRDNPDLKKEFPDKDQFAESVHDILDEMQKNLFERAKQFRETHTRMIDDPKEFEAFFTPKNKNKPEIHGGFALSHWCGSADCEEKLKALKITIRNIPFDPKDREKQEQEHDNKNQKEAGCCIRCGEPSRKRVVFAKAY